MHGVICLETAAKLNGILLLPDEYPLLLFQEKGKQTIPNSSIPLSIIYQDKLDLSDTVEVSNGLYMTTPERTIIDLIRYSRDEEIIYLTLDRYLKEGWELGVSKGTREDLVKISLKYHCDELLQEYLDNMETWISEFYDHT